MNYKRTILLLCATLVVGIAGIVTAEEEEEKPLLAHAVIRQCLLDTSDIADYPAQETNELSRSTLIELYECGDQHDLSSLELFNAMTVLAIRQNVRLIIRGEVLRSASSTYSIGAVRTNMLFIPVEHIAQIELGAAFTEELPHIAISLDSIPPPYAERVRFVGDVTTQTERYYGFDTVSENEFRSAFGITVRTAIATRSLKRVMLYKKNRIAMYVVGFIRPKRWLLHQVQKILSSR